MPISMTEDDDMYIEQILQLNIDYELDIILFLDTFI